LGEPLSTAPTSPKVEFGLNARRAVALLLVYAVGQFVIAMIATIPLVIYYGTTSLKPEQLAKHLQNPVVLIPIAALGILGAALLIIQLTRRFFRHTPTAEAYRELGLSRASARNLLGAGVLGLTLSFLYAIAATKFGPPVEKSSVGPLTQAAMSGGFPGALWAFMAVFLAPPVEEFLFRGALLAGFEKSWGRTTAVLLVTGLFVLLHLTETRSYWPAIIAITCLASVLITVRIRSGSLGPGILLHACYNLGLVLTAYTL